MERNDAASAAAEPEPLRRDDSPVVRYHVNTMIRSGLTLFLLMILGCGGTSLAPSPTPTQTLDLDPETAQLWAGWAAQARQIANLTAQMYNSGAMLPAQVEQQQERAKTLAKEIRSRESSNELVLRLADDLDEVFSALEFGLQYAENTGLRIINIVLPNLRDALTQLAEDATALSEMLEAG